MLSPTANRPTKLERSPMANWPTKRERSPTTNWPTKDERSPATSLSIILNDWISLEMNE